MQGIKTQEVFQRILSVCKTHLSCIFGIKEDAIFERGVYLEDECDTFTCVVVDGDESYAITYYIYDDLEVEWELMVWENNRYNKETCDFNYTLLNSLHSSDESLFRALKLFRAGNFEMLNTYLRKEDFCVHRQ